MSMLNPIDVKSAVPIYVQVAEQIRQRIAAGVLVPGEQLPTVRRLATHLLINPNTVARVYRDLEREGLLRTRRGSGSFVTSTAAALAFTDRQSVLRQQLEELVVQARLYGVSDAALVDLLREILERSLMRVGKAEEP
jgi:GntR family transcriptional regulator